MTRIRELRIERGIQQKDLAYSIGVPANTYNQWETGKREPDYQNLSKIADYFDVSVDYLIGREKTTNLPTSLTTTVAERLKTLRKRDGITQTEFAKIFNVSSGTIGNWETGAREPDYQTLLRIADYFGVSVDYLLGREEKPLVSPAVTTEDEELIEYLEELRSRPEMRMLFSLSKNATKEDVEDAVRIIEALRKGRQS